MRLEFDGRIYNLTEVKIHNNHILCYYTTCGRNHKIDIEYKEIEQLHEEYKSLLVLGYLRVYTGTFRKVGASLIK